ncbi:tetratricopeptide repeat protein [Streptomyces sp. NPDC059567]|uniref:tetratricopeptide repeat protein n=1 Tax=Streptomyces sp. NPDC059567 TaxID=3346867 RepID=UPI0036B8B408
MAKQSLSRQELIRRQRKSGLIGRQGEQAAFKDALQQSPEEASQFLFHIHGPAGVGKSTLVRQLQSVAIDAGALTAYIDESTTDAVEAMEAISSQFSQHGVEMKSFDKLMSNYRQRRHEAASTSASGAQSETAGADQGLDQPVPSPSSVIASQLSLAGLGLIPGVGAFTSAMDPNQVAAGADRVKALLSTRLRSHEDVQLVLSPLQGLTPVFLQGLADAAERRPWVVLLFDTYERTGPMLDVWLRDILVSDRYGQLPANVLVVLAGQSRPDYRCWGDWLDLITDLQLEVFTEAEARQLLATKGTTDEKVIQVILELSGRLPVLVSTLAEARPSSVADVGDPSGTAVERFLRWETSPARRAAALACALPQELDEDIYRTIVDDGESGAQFSWLQSMPFFINRVGRGHYHEVVRSAMLRVQRQQSPMRWIEQHSRLADAFQQRRLQLEAGPPPADGWWGDERWRNYQLQETYHRICADHRAALPRALRELVDAHDHDISTMRRWAQTLMRAGQDGDAPAVCRWGSDLLAALEGPRPGITALTMLLTRGGLDVSGRCLAYILRGWENRRANEYEQALADYTTAIELEPVGRAFRGRGEVNRLSGRYEEALADFNRAIELEPDVAWAFESRGQAYRATGRQDEALADLTFAVELEPESAWITASRGEYYRLAGRHEEAIADFSRTVDIDPESGWAIASRGQVYHSMGRHEFAVVDFSRAIEIDPEYRWAITSRGLTYHAMGRYDEALADYSRAIEIDPEYAWAVVNRGFTYHAMGEYEQALADYSRAIEIDPEYGWAITSRGLTYHAMGRYDEALADCSRAIEIDPEYAWAVANRGFTYHAMGEYEQALADYSRAIEIDPEYRWAITNRGRTYEELARYEDAAADYSRAIEIDPEYGWAIAQRGYAYRLAGQYGEALVDFTRAIEIDPESSFAITNRGVTYRNLGRYDEALIDLSRTIELNPDAGWGHYEMTVVLFALRDPGHEVYFRRVLDICGHSSDVTDRGNVFLANVLMSEWPEAERALIAFMDAQPTNGQIAELLTVMGTLQSVVPLLGEQLSPFSSRLEAALRAPAVGRMTPRGASTP